MKGMAYDLCVGIDPGKITGYSIYCARVGKIVLTQSSDFWKVYNDLTDLSFHNKILVKIEVPTTKANWQKSKHSTTSINIGSVIRESALLYKGVLNLGIDIDKAKPKGKLNYEQVKRITGYKGQTNQHKRDSIMLCYRQIPRLE